MESTIMTDIWDGGKDDKLSGNGNFVSPYLIENAKQLACLADQIQQGDPKNSMVYQLCCHLDLNHIPWTFTEKADRPFDGILLGGGYRIKNLHMDAEQKTEVYTGLFQSLGSSGVIANLHITISPRGITGRSSQTSQVSGLVAVNKGYIANCGVTGQALYAYVELPDEKVECLTMTGGITALNYGQVVNCHGTSDIHAFCIQTSEKAAEKSTFVIAGGLVGKNQGTISNCYGAGKIRGVSTYKNIIRRNECAGMEAEGNEMEVESVFAGGLVGMSEAGGQVDFGYWRYDGIQQIGNQLRIEELHTRIPDCTLGIGNDPQSGRMGSSNQENGGIGKTTAMLTAEMGGKGGTKFGQKLQERLFPIPCPPDTRLGDQAVKIPAWMPEWQENNGYPGLVRQSIKVLNHNTTHPCPIRVERELTFLRDLQYSNNALSGITFALENDLDLKEKEWNTIDEFVGIFDGKNKKISIKRIKDGDSKDACGFIGTLLTGGVIRNLNLEVGEVVSDKAHIGSLVGKCSGILEKCNVTVNRISHLKNVKISNRYVGGVAGIMETDHANISKCFCTIREYLDSSYTVSDRLCLGGICGDMREGSRMKLCGAAGDITPRKADGAEAGAGGTVYAGGVVGTAKTSFVGGCWHHGLLYVMKPDEQANGADPGRRVVMGGVAGRFLGYEDNRDHGDLGIIKCCYSTGLQNMRNGSDGKGNIIGGVAGIISEKGVLENCYSNHGFEGKAEKCGGVAGAKENEGRVGFAFWNEQAVFIGKAYGIGNDEKSGSGGEHNSPNGSENKTSAYKASDGTNGELLKKLQSYSKKVPGMDWGEDKKRMNSGYPVITLVD